MSRRNKKLNTAKINSIPSNQVQGNQHLSNQTQMQVFEAPAEIFALVQGFIPPEKVGEVLEILKMRESNNAKDSDKEFKLARSQVFWKNVLIVGLSFSYVGLVFYLFYKGEYKLGLGSLMSLVTFIGGYGFGQRKSSGEVGGL